MRKNTESRFLFIAIIVIGISIIGNGMFLIDNVSLKNTISANQKKYEKELSNYENQMYECKEQIKTLEENNKTLKDENEELKKKL